MLHYQFTLLTIFASVLVLTSTGCSHSTPVVEAYQPTIAQEGKDVVWIPTPTDLAERLLQAAKVTSSDLVYDLGAGDGKIAILAAQKYKATAVGVEFNPDMAEYARKNVQRAGVSDKVTIITGDIFKEDFSKASVVTLYLLPALNLKLRPTLLAMKPGTRIVSNTFTMGLWAADQTIQGDNGNIGYLWIVPANIQGHWSFAGLPDMGSASVQLTLQQEFQVVNGTLSANDGKSSQPISGRLEGTKLSFDYRDATGMHRTVVAQLINGELQGYLKDQPAIPVVGKKTS
ncbi:MAG: methyltransferase domain-containing protein [Burkholderiaceae bacterium]|nr:methyltransferase domain-containing protein [Burkholderiaceae bacterium]